MNPLLLLTIVVIVVAVAAITRLQPRGGRPAGQTRLMSIARGVLILAALVIAYLVFRGRA